MSSVHICNIQIHIGLDGRNMWPVLKGEKPSEYDELLLQKDQIYGVGALRNKNWKVVHGNTYISFTFNQVHYLL